VFSHRFCFSLLGKKLTITECGAGKESLFGPRRLDAAFFLCTSAGRLRYRCFYLARLLGRKKQSGVEPP
jgi:hypothetical protein